MKRCNAFQQINSYNWKKRTRSKAQLFSATLKVVTLTAVYLKKETALLQTLTPALKSVLSSPGSQSTNVIKATLVTLNRFLFNLALCSLTETNALSCSRSPFL